MNDDIELILEELHESMNKSIQHLEASLLKIRAGKATTNMVDGIMVDYYGSMSPISNVANITTPDARSLVIQPWEKTMLEPISRAIIASNIGLNPQNDGTIIRITVPPLTEERRKDLVKQAKSEAEHAKVGIRSARRDANESIKKLQKNGLPEDMAKDNEDKIQKLTDSYIAKVDVHLEKKEKEIMTV
jgi:ribosome recycling factor